MATYLFVFQALQIREFTYLKRITSGQDDLVTSPLQLTQDGDEKRDMRRVIKVNPNLDI